MERGKRRDALSAFSSWIKAARGSVAQRFSAAKIAVEIFAGEDRCAP
jgi:hypothetical protein